MEYIAVIRDLGFPIFVSVYLLIFMHKALEANREALLLLKESQESLRSDLKEIRDIVLKAQEGRKEATLC